MGSTVPIAPIRTWWTAVAAAALALACSKQNTINQYGAADAAPSDAAGGAAAWSCLGAAPLTPDPRRSIAIALLLSHASSGDPVTSAIVDVCDKLDVDCVGTSGDYPKGLAPDSSGNVSLAVREGFDGFVRVQGDDLVTSALYFGRPLVAPPARTTFQLLRPTEYEGLAGIAHSAVDATRGSALLFAEDCDGAGAAAVSFHASTADAASEEFYLINQAPVLPPAAPATDADGIGGFFNLPTGSAAVQARRADDDVIVGESSFISRADEIAYVVVGPEAR